MPRIDFGHLYKFIASTGLVLVAAAFLVPWFFTQSLAVLEIPEARLVKLTETAQEVILERQAAIAATQAWLLVGAGVALLIGLALLIWGIVRWNRRQVVQDKNENADLSKKLADLRPASPDEIATKLDEEVQLSDETGGEDAVEAAAQPRRDLSPSAGEPTPSGSDHRARVELLKRAEDRVLSLLSTAFSEEFTVRANMTQRDGSGHREVLDVVLTPVDDENVAEIGVDVRRVATRFNTSTLLDSMIRAAIATKGFRGGVVPGPEAGAPVTTAANAILIVVFSDRETMITSPSITRTKLLVQAANSVLVRKVGVVMVGESVFERMSPAELRAAVSAGIVHPDKVWVSGRE